MLAELGVFFGAGGVSAFCDESSLDVEDGLALEVELDDDAESLLALLDAPEDGDGGVE